MSVLVRSFHVWCGLMRWVVCTFKSDTLRVRHALDACITERGGGSGVASKNRNRAPHEKRTQMCGVTTTEEAGRSRSQRVPLSFCRNVISVRLN